MTKTAKQLDHDLIEHACSQLGKKARQHVSAGMTPASAAYAAIRETRALFPPDWQLAVQGGDQEDEVEVWEVEHKRSAPCARVVRETEAEAKQLLVAAVKERARAPENPAAVRRVARWSDAKVLDILRSAMPQSAGEAYNAVYDVVMAAERAKPKKPKRRAYDINPSSPEVVKAFMASGQPATYTGVQEFISDRYGAWMNRQPAQFRADSWTEIQSELTEALSRHGVKVEDD